MTTPGLNTLTLGTIRVALVTAPELEQELAFMTPYLAWSLPARFRPAPGSWRASLPADPTPEDEGEAWTLDAATVAEARRRIEDRRAAQVSWHRARLAELEAA